MATPSDFDGSLVFTAPTGGVTYGTPVKVQDTLVLPTTGSATNLGTAAAGTAFTGLILMRHARKMLRSAAKATGAAWTAGQALYWDNTNANWTTTASGNTAGYIAGADAASGDTTGTVVPVG